MLEKIFKISVLMLLSILIIMIYSFRYDMNGKMLYLEMKLTGQIQNAKSAAEFVTESLSPTLDKIDADLQDVQMLCGDRR